jgi:predicted nuclease of predicted toxin-antitoxin system
VNLLLDQGLPRLAVPELRRFGLDVVHAGDVGMAAATDDELLLFARREGRVIVTLDADFHALLALSNAATPSVVRLRIEGLRAQPLAASLADGARRMRRGPARGSDGLGRHGERPRARLTSRPVN